MFNFKMNRKNKILFFGGTFIFLFLLVAFIYPISDDWYYLTSPHPSFDLHSALIPTKAFWRPFDALFGGLMGKVPFLFPYLNKALVVLAHVLSAFFMYRITELLKYKEQSRFISVLVFTFSSAMISVIISPDALNQSMSLLFGVIGLYFYLKNNSYTYLIFVLISVLWKESGIIFLAVIPLIGMMKSMSSIKDLKKNFDLLKKLILCAVIAVIFAVIYFAVRFYLYGSVALGDSSGRYSVSVFSFSTVKNIVNMFLLATTGADSIAILSSPKNYFLAGITVALSLVFLTFIFICLIRMIKNKSGIFGFLILALCTFALALPQAIIEKSGEMHAYPVLFGVAMLYGYIMNFTQKSDGKKAVATIICLLTAFVISSAHKFVAVYECGINTKKLTENIHQYYTNDTQKLILVDITENRNVYSVFVQSPMKGTDNGQSLRQYFGWHELDIDAKHMSANSPYEEFAHSVKGSSNVVLVVDGTDVKEIR